MDTAISNSLSSISPQELVARLGQSNAPLLLDVRKPEPFAKSTHLLPGAQYCAPQDVAQWIATHSAAPREVVVYCVYGHHVSQTAAAQLHAAGWDVKYLQGGIEGGQDGEDAAQDIARWRSAALPKLSKRADWGITGTGRTRWITRANPKIDRIACPWLVRRWVDAQAEFFYVPDAQVLGEAKRLQAAAYDIVGAPITHEGELCSFDALLQGLGLQTPALLLLARIVRGSDTNLLHLEPPCAGLLAITQGMARLHAGSDHAMLEAMMPIYDALYAWCVDKVAGQVQPHVWTSPPPAGDAELRRMAEHNRRG
jgi:rhodanese-related sulfurtransferase